jgi:N-acetylglucosamine kinase-like BadF-type ATPase
MPRSEVTRILVDGGGSTTRAALWFNGGISARSEGGSCNHISVGPDRAISNLRSVIQSVWNARDHRVDTIDAAWFCLSTAASPTALTYLAKHLVACLPEPTDDLWVTNDIAPLLVHDGRTTRRVVAICGTGTGFCALNPEEGLCVRTSGHDYLLADEGGGFDLGLQGLRAIMRAADGRGPETSLTEQLAPWRGVSVAKLHDLVYASIEPKVLIASFAPFVLMAAENGDSSAQSIVDRATTELVTGIQTAARGARLVGAYEVTLAGSNLTSPKHSILRDRLRSFLIANVPGVSIRIVASPLQAVSQMAEVLPEEARLLRILKNSLPFLHATPSNP